MQEVVDITEETKKHEDEWLLFEVIETDDHDRPLRGRLLAHSKDRDDVHEVVMKHMGLDLQTIYTGDLVPPDVVPVL
ncbi:MAG: hypothetical protein ACYS9X_28875 [Planctomycetota bacterium]|jgi:hypothetical protein